MKNLITLSNYSFPLSYQDYEKLITEVTQLALSDKMKGTEAPIKISEKTQLDTLEQLLNNRYYFIINQQ